MKILLTAFALSIFIVFAACGGDDDDEPDATDPPAATPTASETAEPSPAPTPTDEPEPPTELTDAMIDAITAYVAANDIFDAQREMTDPPRCEDAVDGAPDLAGKVCVAGNSFTTEGENAVVNTGLWASDAVATFVLEPDGDGWIVAEVRDANDVGDPTELTDEMIAAIAEYVANNDMFGERRVMTDPPRCEETDYNNAPAQAGKVCVVSGTFTVTPQNVLVNAGLWASDAVLTMVLEQVDESAWAVVDTRDDFGN